MADTHAPIHHAHRTRSEWRVTPTRARDGILVQRYAAPGWETLVMRVVFRRESGMVIAARAEVVSVPITVLEWALAELARLDP